MASNSFRRKPIFRMIEEIIPSELLIYTLTSRWELSFTVQNVITQQQLNSTTASETFKASLSCFDSSFLHSTCAFQ